MNETVGIIGSGMIGGQVARLATSAGINVAICNSRGPSSIAGLISELGPKARATTFEDVAASAQLLVLAVPFGVYSKLPVDTLAGKIVVDTLNYYPERDGVMPEVQTLSISTSELVQKHLARSIIVRALNNVDFVRLFTNARSKNAPDRSALPVAGDSVDAKAKVIAFLDQIGYDAVDMGPLAQSWRSEPTMPVYVAPYMKTEASYMARKIDLNTFMSAPGRAVSAGEVRRLVRSAVRHDNMVGMMPVFD